MEDRWREKSNCIASDPELEREIWNVHIYTKYIHGHREREGEQRAVSPKVKTVYTICRFHIESNICYFTSIMLSAMSCREREEDLGVK